MIKSYWPSMREAISIYSLASPILLSVISNTILMIVDVAMVGSLGAKPLAVIGVGITIFIVAEGFVWGIQSSVQTIVARRSASSINNIEHEKIVVSATVLATIVGLLITALFYFATPVVLKVLFRESDLIEPTIEYMDVRILGLTFVSLNCAFTGFWNALKKSKYNFYITLATQALNIFLNYVFIFGNFGAPPYGVVGSAMGTNIALVLAVLFHIFLIRKKVGIMVSKLSSATSEYLKLLMKLAAPHSMFLIMYCFSNMLILSVVEGFGVYQLAGMNILTRLVLLFSQPAHSLGQVGGILVSEALGHKDKELAYRKGWKVLILGLITMAVLASIVIAFPELFLKIFTSDLKVIEVATLPLIIIAFSSLSDVIHVVLSDIFIGAGNAKKFMYVNLIFQWVLIIPCIYFFTGQFEDGLVVVVLTQLIGRAMLSIVFLSIWIRKSWGVLF